MRCRAGSKGGYCFGDDEATLVDYAWYDKNSGSKTHPAGEKKANDFGLHDMHGNVWEWCWDGYENYNASSIDDPRGPAEAPIHVFRGGCWSGAALD